MNIFVGYLQNSFGFSSVTIKEIVGIFCQRVCLQIV